MERTFKIRCSQIGKIMSNAKKEGELSVTCKTYLKEWYANDREEVESKYINKGNWVENDLIDFMADVLGFGMAEKNIESKEDDYFTGTCDVVMPNCIIDVKAPWSAKTLHDQSFEIDSDYEWQGLGYMHLYKKDEFILFYGLMDTPEEVNYGKEVIYSTLPVKERWAAFKRKQDAVKIEQIQARVIQCRTWLDQYDKDVKSKLGTIQIL